MYEIYQAGDSKSAKPNTKPTEPATQPSNTKAPNCRTVDDYSETMRREKPTSSLLAAFAPKPLSVSFDSQAETEKVILLLRQHPVVLLKPAILLLIGLVFPLVLNLTPFLDFLPAKFYLGFFLGWYVILAGMTLQAFLVWFFNVYIVTDERIIDVDFLSIIHKNVSAAKIENIEDITVMTSGAAASIFDYGTVLIQTAAEKNEFEFENVPHPTKIASILNDIILEEEREKIAGHVS